LKPVQGPVEEVLLLLLIAGPMALLATSVAAYWLARKALRPVEQLTSDARQIGNGGLHERVAVSASRDEIGRLGLTLNAMLDRIERGVTDKHRLVADASHALRTPLAVMRAEIDVSLRGDELPVAARDVLESAREEVDRMSRTVDNLLALAEADEGRLELLTVPVSLRRAIDDSARPLRLLAAAKDVSLLAEGAPIEAQADPQRLHLAVTNLIENAIKFSPPGGRVRVTTWSRGSEVGITVSDEGPGIPPEDREHLFDRYYRVDRARGHKVAGSGLGLAISREVALSHGGRLWLESVVGGGSTFFLALPSWRAIQAADNDSTPADDPGGHFAPNA
jgi:signal transduction histidine kinase